MEATAQTQDEAAATSVLHEDLDNPALADLTRAELIELVEQQRERGIRISFSGKGNARGLARLTGRAAALLAAALISSPAVVQVAGAAAAAPAAAQPLADLTAAPSVCRALSPVSVTTDIYGGTDSAFRVDAGPLVHQRVPAAGFNPLLAPDAQLALYGFLPRPTDQARLATWTRRYQKFTGFAKPGLCVRDALSNAQTDPAARSKDRAEQLASGGVLLIAALGIALVWRRRSTSGGPPRRRMWLKPR